VQCNEVIAVGELGLLEELHEEGGQLLVDIPHLHHVGQLLDGERVVGEPYKLLVGGREGKGVGEVLDHLAHFVFLLTQFLLAEGAQLQLRVDILHSHRGVPVFEFVRLGDQLAFIRG